MDFKAPVNFLIYGINKQGEIYKTVLCCQECAILDSFSYPAQ